MRERSCTIPRLRAASSEHEMGCAAFRFAGGPVDDGRCLATRRGEVTRGQVPLRSLYAF
jgi:hypothetical protein